VARLWPDGHSDQSSKLVSWRVCKGHGRQNAVSRRFEEVGSCRPPGRRQASTGNRGSPSLEEASRAHELVEHAEVQGKLVLIPNG